MKIEERTDGIKRFVVCQTCERDASVVSVGKIHKENKL